MFTWNSDLCMLAYGYVCVVCVCACVHVSACLCLWFRFYEFMWERLSPGPCRVMAQGAALPAGRRSWRQQPLSLSGLVLLTGLEGNLQHAVTQAIAVKASNSHGSFIVVGHGDKAKALTFVGGEVTDDLDIGDCTERPEELPQDTFVRLRGQVVHKDAPAGSSWTGKVDASQTGHAVNGDGWESGEESGRTTMGVILKFHTAFSALYCL